MRRFEKMIWWFFLIWAFVGIITLFLGKIRLPAALVWADALFLLLAAINVFFIITRTEGLRVTMMSFFIIALGSGLIETCGALTGWPFGPYSYTEYLGWRLGNTLPLIIPLAWWSVIGMGHAFARICFPSMTRWGAAFFCGLWATLFDLLLEPFAWKVKSYWIWQQGYVPWNNYVAWFITAFLLCVICPWKNHPLPEQRVRLAIIASLMGLTFWVGIVKAV